MRASRHLAAAVPSRPERVRFGAVERKRLNHAGLRRLCKPEVIGSIPIRSTLKTAGNGALCWDAWSRLLLAEAIAAGDREGAARQLAAALPVFDRLASSSEAGRTRALLAAVRCSCPAAAEDDEIGPLAEDFGENGLERDGVAVHVGASPLALRGDRPPLGLVA